MNKQMKKNKKGFTLVEMIVVIAIIGVLAAMMVPSLLGYIEKANTSNNRAAATNVGRTAQAVLADLNDSAITGNYTGATKGASTKGVNMAGAGTSTEFKKAMSDMYAYDVFDGYFDITIASGSVQKVVYKKAAAPGTSTLTKSTKELGIYPEG